MDIEQGGIGMDERVQSISRPNRLHPSSLIFDLVSHARQFVIPVLIALFSAAKGSTSGLIVGVIFLVMAAASSVFTYFTLRYSISGDELVVRKGLIFRSLRTIPLHRIQNVDLTQNLFHRMIGVAEVRVETAGGSEPEAKLRVLSLKQVEALRHGIFDERSKKPVAPVIQGHSDDAASGPDDFPVLAQHSVETTLLEIPTSSLIKAGLASNRGMLLIGVAIGLYFQFDLHETVDPRILLKFLPEFRGTLLDYFLWGLAIFAVFALLRVFGAFWYLLRFSGYRLARNGEDLRIACGLFTRVSATIPRKRIQFISVHRPLFMKWIGLASIRIETAGGGKGENESAASSVSRRWFVPVVREPEIGPLLSELREGLTINESELDWQPLSPTAFRRMVRLSLIFSVLLSAGCLFITRPWGAFAGLIAAPILIQWSRKKSRSMRYCRENDKIVFRSGVLYKITSATFFDKVQTASFHQSPFDRKWKHASLVIDTAGSGPAEHVISIDFLDEVFARQEYENISAIAALARPDFG